jgi:hypothetical protein
VDVSDALHPGLKAAQRLTLKRLNHQGQNVILNRVKIEDQILVTTIVITTTATMAIETMVEKTIVTEMIEVAMIVTTVTEMIEVAMIVTTAIEVVMTVMIVIETVIDLIEIVHVAIEMNLKLAKMMY